MNEQDRKPEFPGLEALTEAAKKGAPDCLPPVDMGRKAQTVAINKAKLDTLSTVLLGILAGSFIGLGAMLCTLVTTDSGMGFGPTKLLGGFVFSLGLILVVLAGAELFTGNTLMVMSWFSGKIGFGRLLRNWGLVYTANFVGSLMLVALMFYSLQWTLKGDAVGANAVLIANGKVNLSFTSALARGILCNALVCLAIWLCFSARTVVDKIVAIIFPITAFVTAGFEHSIANMYFIPMGIALAGDPQVLQAAGLTPAAVSHLSASGLVANLVPVTIGNIIGGSLFVGAVYWAAYLHQDRADAWAAIKRWLRTLVPAPRHAELQQVVEIFNGNTGLRETLARAVLSQHGKLDETIGWQHTGSPGLTELLARAVRAKAEGNSAFFSGLSRNPEEALKGYALSAEEKAALSTGDVKWLEAKVEKVPNPLATWSILRLASRKQDKTLEGAGVRNS